MVEKNIWRWRLMATNDKTMFFDFGQERQEDIKQTLKTVYESLEEKGYNPINQIVGYLLSRVWMMHVTWFVNMNVTKLLKSLFGHT